ncbi:MAG: hypothetical protein EZS28_005259 [Streblomastix strix]|uniref:Cyclin N-terminal domain-containing protein n=1 Tax=Streblomastix strix TaxID=222440 RepID=A0A5J4WW27_9EUKA|nr:MAG: hypothetical protein EZS28_005259 [Streblomastix strix]
MSEFTVVPTKQLHIDNQVLSHINHLRLDNISSLEMPPKQSLIKSSSYYLMKLLSNVLYQQETSLDQQLKNESLFLKIKSFFSYIYDFAQLSGSELIYTIYLVQKLVNSEIQDFIEDNDCIMIADSNIGTTLICAVILAMKILRDPTEMKSNIWWAKSFGMSLELLNQSEMEFYMQLDFNVSLDEQQFIRLYSQILSYSEV